MEKEAAGDCLQQSLNHYPWETDIDDSIIYLATKSKWVQESEDYAWPRGDNLC